ncbi:MAG TPA: hypothetical protein VIS05_05005 [Ilumatobacter sp.]
MRSETRRWVRAIVSGLLASALVACGGGADEVSVTAPTSAGPASSTPAELAGVHIEVRRDPG